MLATAAPGPPDGGEPDDQLKCLGSLLLKLLLDASPTGLVLSTQSWLLPEVYRSWETARCTVSGELLQAGRARGQGRGGGRR